MVSIGGFRNAGEVVYVVAENGTRLNNYFGLEELSKHLERFDNIRIENPKPDFRGYMPRIRPLSKDEKEFLVYKIAEMKRRKE